MASNDIKIYVSSRLKNLRFKNTLMTSHECGATLTRIFVVLRVSYEYIKLNNKERFSYCI